MGLMYYLNNPIAHNHISIWDRLLSYEYILIFYSQRKGANTSISFKFYLRLHGSSRRVFSRYLAAIACVIDWLFRVTGGKNNRTRITRFCSYLSLLPILSTTFRTDEKHPLWFLKISCRIVFTNTGSLSNFTE